MKVVLRKTILGLLLGVSSAHAEDLMDIYNLSIKNDQQFQAATAQRMATAEALPQAIALLFPQIGLTGASTMNRVETTHNELTPSSNGLIKYNSFGYTLTTTLPLINFSDWFGVSQAKATVKQADATYAAAAQDLIIRTSQAYFNVLLAEDNLRLTRAQKEFVAKELAQAKARFEVGVDAISSVYNAEASYDSLVAQEMSDENFLSTAYQNLQVITGQPVERLSKVMNDLPLIQPTPNNLNAWLKAAERRNFSLLAQRYTADAAREGIRVAESGHLPTLSANETYQYNNQGPLNGGITNTQAVGLTLTIPLFSGGQVLSQTRQNEDLFVVATSNLEALHRQVLADTSKVYSTVLTSMSRVMADRATIVAKNNALESNQAAYQAGTMTIIDVLNATQDLYNAQKIYAADQYNYLLNTLQLKQQAGNLTDLDVEAINRWMRNNGYTTSASQIAKIASNLRPTANLNVTPKLQDSPTIVNSSLNSNIAKSKTTGSSVINQPIVNSNSNAVDNKKL